MSAQIWVRAAATLFFIVQLSLVGCTKVLKEGERYNEICDVVRSGPDSKPSSQSYGNLNSRSHSQRDPKEDRDARYSGDAFRDLVMARSHVRNLRARYSVYACNRERMNDSYYDRPLIISAIAAGAAALAKSNPYVIGGIGLAAGGVAAFKAHDHPEVDRDAYFEAYEKLTCAYDATHSLRDNLRLETLKEDRKALRVALDEVNADNAAAGAQTSGGTATAKAAADAAKSARDAGNAALDAVSKEIQNYDSIADAIYSLGSAADIAARKATHRNGSYAAAAENIKTTYQSVSETALKKADAEAKISKAVTSDAVAKSLVATSPPTRTAPASEKGALYRLVSHSTALHPASTALQSFNLLSDTEPSTSDVGGSTAPALSDTVEIKDLPVWSALADSSTSRITKLIRAAEVTTNDLPAPSYTQIIAKISTCSAL